MNKSEFVTSQWSQLVLEMFWMIRSDRVQNFSLKPVLNLNSDYAT